jgi:hypothetical protein
MPAATQHEFRADLSAVQEAIRAGVTHQRTRAHDLHWERWEQFCLLNGLDPQLEGINDPVPFLQVFGTRYQDGRIAPSGQPVRARTVEDAL